MMAPLKVWVPRYFVPNQHIVYQTRELAELPMDLKYKVPAAAMAAHRENNDEYIKVPRQMKIERNRQDMWMFPFLVRNPEVWIDSPSPPVSLRPWSGSTDRDFSEAASTPEC